VRRTVARLATELTKRVTIIVICRKMEEKRKERIGVVTSDKMDKSICC
jgi:hypothetical protein